MAEGFLITREIPKCSFSSRRVFVPLLVIWPVLLMLFTSVQELDPLFFHVFFCVLVSLFLVNLLTPVVDLLGVTTQLLCVSVCT